MRYRSVFIASFVSRPNRFVAIVSCGGQEILSHVKNTGRCRELLVPGARVVMARAENPARKTGCDLVAVWKGELLINMDSHAPNAAAAEYLAREYPGWSIRPESTLGESRFDFELRRDGRSRFVEVKGVTLERDGTALFPDAPTARGVKHLRGLSRIAREGGEAELLLVIQFSGAKRFRANRETDPTFADALIAAREAGVRIRAVECRVAPEGMEITGEIPVEYPERA